MNLEDFQVATADDGNPVSIRGESGDEVTVRTGIPLQLKEELAGFGFQDFDALDARLHSLEIAEVDESVPTSVVDLVKAESRARGSGN
jgi:hypothetical protein